MGRRFKATLLLMIFTFTGYIEGNFVCDRTPEAITAPKSRANNRFVINIRGDPETYSPGEMYTVGLAGVGRGTAGAAKFKGFSLSVETTSRSGGKPGSFFLLGDLLTKFSTACLNTITHTSDTEKTEIQALWTAPSQGTGCVVFKATIVEEDDLWYQDDGSLSKTLCEDLQQSNEEQPEINPTCCACDEAKYEVIFEGVWSRHTHPKDFPDNSLTRFSDVIGASHTTEYRFWEYGGKASEGLKQVAELGSTRMLESELKSQSENIRTIIKARGISYPNVTSKTFAVFRVDSRNHLISLVSMIDPSPDWVVGVSGLELCLSNCSWRNSAKVDLYPWDVGTDSGITYTSPDQPTEPRDHIRQITTLFPSDPRSPFYDPTGERMKPLAHLYLTRQRLYEKSCPDSNGDVSSTNDVEETDDPLSSFSACEVGEWSEWSSCSATCGSGKKSRQRFYKDPSRANMANCNRELTSRSNCDALFPCSSEGLGREVEPFDSTMCAMSEWSPWSGCSVSCGRGVKHRFRTMKHKRNWKKCMASDNPPQTKQAENCIGERGETCPDGPILAPLVSKCEAGPWSEWSACSVTCGTGIRSRHREIIGPSPRSVGRTESCNGINSIETITCSELPDCELSSEQAKEVCQLPKTPGPCRGHFEKWYFDTVTLSCLKFVYSGCRGNRNQFESQEECETSCKDVKERLSYHGPFGGIAIEAQTRNEDTHVLEGAEGPVVDCRVSHWTGWSECSVSCGRGLRQKTRTIIMNARNGGKGCPKKLLRRKKCNAGPCTTGYLSDEEMNVSDYDEESPDDCVYAEWSPWSLCSATCGFNSVQQRTRNLMYGKTNDKCGVRLQTRLCNVPPCKSDD